MAFLTALAIGATVIGTLGQISAAKKAARAQREANAVAGAGEDIKNRAARRAAAREERIRRGQLAQTASTTGTTRSSGFLGAVSSLGANFGSAVARQSEQGLVAQGISAANQKAADAQSKFNMFGQLIDFSMSGLDFYNKWKAS